MVKVLVVTQSCQRDLENGRQNAIEETWLDRWGHLITHRFVLGGALSFNGSFGNWYFPVPDHYDAVAFKCHAAMQQAREEGYTNVFYSDTDTFINVPKLLVSDYTRAPYIGLRCDQGHASGGAGFWVSGPAIKVLAEAKPTSGFSDMWVADHLRRAGIGLDADNRYYGSPPKDRPKDLITAHLEGDISLMHKFFEGYKND
jgi:hypothetical protein